jgi:hypothetical protein
MQAVVMRDKITGETRRVDPHYAALHVVTRGKTRASGAEVARRLIEGERFETPAYDFYAWPEAWTEVA